MTSTPVAVAWHSRPGEPACKGSMNMPSTRPAAESSTSVPFVRPPENEPGRRIDLQVFESRTNIISAPRLRHSCRIHPDERLLPRGEQGTDDRIAGQRGERFCCKLTGVLQALVRVAA